MILITKRQDKHFDVMFYIFSFDIWFLKTVKSKIHIRLDLDFSKNKFYSFREFKQLCMYIVYILVDRDAY